MSNQQNLCNSTWKSQTGYIWSLIGSAVGFANILSFSAQVYKNGGGAFLIPYCMALFVLGIPFLLLEGTIGSRLKSPLVTAYGLAWGSLGKVFGWLAVLACVSIGSFYIVLTGYSVAYTYFAAMNEIPEDTKSFFLNSFLKTTPSLLEMGQLSWPVFLSTVAVAILSWVVVGRAIRDGIERVCTIFMPLLAVIMTLFAVIALLLPGGVNGLVYYLQPNFEKLFDVALWRDVFGQLFFSLSLGLGIVVGYSRHTQQQTNIARAMLYVALGDFAVSFISGAAIFGCLAHISYTQNIPFDSILTSDSTFEIGFIVFPQILKFFGPTLSQAVGMIFFFCVFIAGITGVFSIIESIAGNVEVEFRLTRKQAVSVTTAVLMALGIFFCFGNAMHLIDTLAPMVMGTNMLIGGLGLILAFVYGKKALQDYPGKDFYGFCLRYIAPALLGIILAGTFIQDFQNLNLAFAVRWGWLGVALLLSYSFVQLTKKESVELLATNR